MLTQDDLRARVHGVTATATSAWKPDKRKEMAVKGWALPDGSYPIKDKTDWHKAKQALGRAKNRAAVIKHLKKRGKALGIPVEEYEGLTAAAWDPLRHPRGHNGQFIEVGGWVKGLFRLANGQKGERRGQVTSISPNRSDPNNPTIHITTTDGENATALANTIDGSVPSKAALDKPGDKQLSLGDAPIGGNKEMPGAQKVPSQELKEKFAPDYAELGPALKKHYDQVATDMVNSNDDFGRHSATLLDDAELDEAITELTERVSDPERRSMSGRADLKVLQQEQAKRLETPEVTNYGLDEGMLYSGNAEGASKSVAGEPAPLRPFDGEPLNQWGESEAQYRTRRASEIGVAVDENGVPLNDADTKRLADHLAKGASAPMDESRRYKDDEVDRGEDASAWRDDILKVQNALKQGGWITSVPDDSAPGGVFTYIDPDAPEDLKRLYQELMQMGYANGWV